MSDLETAQPMPENSRETRFGEQLSIQDIPSLDLARFRQTLGLEFTPKNRQNEGLVRGQQLAHERRQVVDSFNPTFRPNPDLENFLSGLQIESLTPDQQAAVNTAQRIFRLIPPYCQKDHFITTHLELSQLTQNKDRLADELTVLEQIYFEAIKKDNGKDALLGIQQTGYTEGLKILESEGMLKNMASLINQGWRIGDFYASSIFTTSGPDAHFRTALQKAAQQQEAAKSQPPEVLDFLEDVLKDSNPEAYQVLTEKSLDKGPLLEALSRENNRNIVNALARLAERASTDPQQRKEILAGLISFDPILGISPNVESIDKILTELPLDEVFNSIESNFWKSWIVVRDQRYFKGKLLPHILLAHQQKLVSSTQGGQASLELYRTVARDFESYLPQVQNLNPDSNNTEQFMQRMEYGEAMAIGYFVRLPQCPLPYKLMEDFNRRAGLLPGITAAIYPQYSRWEEFFKDGVMQPSLIETIATKVGTKNLYNETSRRILQFDIPQDQERFWDMWDDQSREIQQAVAENFSKFLGREKPPEELLESYLKIYKELYRSPSKEIRRLRERLLGQLFQSDNPEQKAQQIRTVFERNHLPEVGKIFRVFEILYPQEQFRATLERRGNKANLSPVLTQVAETKKHGVMYRGIIYRDLMKIHIESANPSLYGYLVNLRDSEGLLDRVDSGQELTSNDQTGLDRFLARLDTLQQNSLYGREKNGQPDLSSLATQDKIKLLKQELGVLPNQRISDRISQMFLAPLGYRNLDEVLHRMETSKSQAHYRNIALVRNLEEGRIMPEAGDQMKGVDNQYLNELLWQLASKEYLGSSADSDMTPFDLDTSLVLDSDTQSGLSGALQRSIARNYGDLVFVVKNRGQFQPTSKGQPTRYDPSKYELFQTGVHGERHYGIRTGLPATEIDYMVARDKLLLSEEDTERVYHTIAQNGFYIPVVDVEGRVIFTPEDYEKYRVKYEQASKVLNSENFDPAELISVFKDSPYLARLYESDAGVSEKYSLEQHTIMMMTQFERYFTENFPNTLIPNKNLFRLMLALHDLGKPLAQQMTGSTSAQHEYTMKFLPQIIEGFGVDSKTADILIGIANQDYIGEFMQEKTNGEKTAGHIKQLSEDLGVPTKDLYQLMMVYYMSDASSYTEDAGGKKSLDNLFVFQRGSNENRGMLQFSPDAQSKIDELNRLLAI